VREGGGRERGSEREDEREGGMERGREGRRDSLLISTSFDLEAREPSLPACEVVPREGLYVCMPCQRGKFFIII
jgi:hypothetical protein